MMPEKVATRMPLRRLNSLMTSCFFLAGISRSLDIPAIPAKAMPLRHTATPVRMTRPEMVPSTFGTKTPSKIGGIRVPNAAQ